MIESWLPDGAWPDSVRDAVQRFRQGNIVAWSSVVYGAAFSHGICIPTRETGDNGSGFVRIDEPWDHVMITSQTCDICEEGKKRPRFPWISVAPVFDILPAVRDKGQQKQIRSGDFAYLVPLTAAEFSGQGSLWVADLRLEYPLEKSVLVGMPVREAFATEDEYQKLANRLATRRSRPAIDGFVRSAVIGPLGEALRSDRISHNDIAEIRIRCGPKWDVVERARLIFLIYDGASLDDIASQVDAWEAEVKRSLPPEFVLMSAVVQEYQEFSYVESLSAPLVDFSEFSE